MFKRYNKIILIIILIIQLSVPFSFLIYQGNINKHLNEDSEYIKINIDSIWHDSISNKINIELDLNSIYNSDEFYENNYIIFEPSENNEYSSINFSDFIKATNEHYLHKEAFYKLENINYNYENEYLSGVRNFELYDKTIELKNVVNGYCTGELTEAYAIIKIYKNHLKIEEIYIGGYTLDEFVNLYGQSKIDISRFHKKGHYNYSTLKKSDYLKYIDENKIFLYEDFLQSTDNENESNLITESLQEILDEARK